MEKNTQEETLITHEPIENTPFVITGNEGQGYFLRMGSYRLTEFQQTQEKVKEALHKESWLIIVNVMAAILNADKEHLKTT